MRHPVRPIPWHTPALWKEANSCLAKTIQRNRTALSDLFPVASRIRRQLGRLFPAMDDLCRLTCSHCTDVCCRKAWVWADFRDLLFYHLAGIHVPERQLMSRRRELCRYAGPRGCRLARLQRPFVCTWYRCPAQTCALEKVPAVKIQIEDSLTDIQALRKIVEQRFVQALL